MKASAQKAMPKECQHAGGPEAYGAKNTPVEAQGQGALTKALATEQWTLQKEMLKGSKGESSIPAVRSKQPFSNAPYSTSTSTKPTNKMFKCDAVTKKAIWPADFLKMDGGSDVHMLEEKLVPKGGQRTALKDRLHNASPNSGKFRSPKCTNHL